MMELPNHMDPRYIVRVLRTLGVEGDVIEMRLLGVHNAGHISGYFDNLPNDEEHTALIRACLTVIAARFSDKTVDVDRKVFNPARRCKLYGTLVRKGDNMPDRPYRRSRLDIPHALYERKVSF